LTAAENPPSVGENRRVAFEALLVGLAIVILNLAASLLAQFVFFPALSYDTTLFGLLPWVSPVFTRLVPFFLIFYIAERERIDPFLRWYETVASLFLGGVVIGMILPIVEPIAEQYVFSLRYPQGSFSFQFLFNRPLEYALGSIYAGLDMVFLGMTAISMGYFWARMPPLEFRIRLEAVDSGENTPSQDALEQSNRGDDSQGPIVSLWAPVFLRHGSEGETGQTRTVNHPESLFF